MDFRDLIDSADDVVMTTFAEPALIDGRPVDVIVNDEPYQTPSLDVPVDARVVTLMLRTPIAQGLRLTKGMQVEFRGQRHEIRDSNPDNFGMTRIEIG